ncbi:MAG: aminotransferase class V-fold PLP-dependent enzyme [Nitrospirales bacterium]|nr:MAG: aminotransferase class V-fold PLP-dependent enzyme [Nitrospirales bacterium]
MDGRMFPIKRLYQLTQKYRALLIVDGAQAVGHIPVDFHDWQPDAYFFPGHKWCAGPMGTGALILGNQHTECDERKEPRQPSWADYELGTQNIGLIAGFAKACLNKQEDGMKTARLEQIREKVRQELSKSSQFRIIEWDGPHSPGILSLTSQRKETNAPLQSKSHDIVWKTFQLPNKQEQTGIRLSWSSDTSEAEIESLLTFLQNQNRKNREYDLKRANKEGHPK